MKQTATYIIAGMVLGVRPADAVVAAAAVGAVGVVGGRFDDHADDGHAEVDPQRIDTEETQATQVGQDPSFGGQRGN